MKVTVLNSEYEVRIWKNEYLGRIIAIDTETEVLPFYMTPRIATLQAFSGGTNVYYIPMDRLHLFFNRHYDSILVFHNAAFDVDTISKKMGSRSILDSYYDRCTIRDTAILYRLFHLAKYGFTPKKWNLGLLSEMFLGLKLDKEGEERIGFSQFIDCSITSIPESFLTYGAIDVIATFYLYQTLMGLVKNFDYDNTLLSHDIQIKGDLALLHIHKNGIGFDLQSRDAWLSSMDKEIEKESNVLATWGWCRGMKGINERYEKIMEYLELSDKLPRTKEGGLSSKADDLKDFNHLPFVHSFLNFQEMEKATSFVRDVSSNILHPRYNLLMNTGRTSCTSPNVQQLPKVGGVRELFIPSNKNSVFIDIDYSALELATLSQVCYTRFGHSTMREKINEGKCLHYYTASHVYQKEESKITKEERQFAKIPNFGFAANMAPATFVQYCQNYNISISEQRAMEVKEAWKRAYPEINKFFNVNETTIYTLTGRARANCSYTAYLNTQFQGLAADGFKLALYNVDKAGYKISAQIHDQIVIEHPREGAEEAMKKIQEIMESSMSIVCPDVTIRTEGNIIERFTK